VVTQDVSIQVLVTSGAVLSYECYGLGYRVRLGGGVRGGEEGKGGGERRGREGGGEEGKGRGGDEWKGGGEGREGRGEEGKGRGEKRGKGGGGEERKGREGERDKGERGGEGRLEGTWRVREYMASFPAAVKWRRKTPPLP
jgi:hypothetical protein